MSLKQPESPALSADPVRMPSKPGAEPGRAPFTMPPKPVQAVSLLCLVLPLLLAGVTPRNLGEAIAIMKGDSKFYIETTALLAPGAIEMVRDSVPNGIERMVFASYSPLRYLSSALHPIIYSALSDEEKGLILGGNLKQLLTNA